MKPLFIKITLFFLMFCNIALAQKVTYVVENEEGIVGLAFFEYKKGGNYEATFGKNKTRFEIKPDSVVETLGDFVITISLEEEDKYYHDYFGMWRTTLLTTSNGYEGFAKVYYEGETKIGRSYYSEIWIEGEMVSKSKTVVDQKDQIIYKTTIDESGLMHIKRN